MDKVNGDCDMFDTSGDCVCLQDVNARLAVSVDRSREDHLSWEAKEFSDCLKIVSTGDASEGTTNFAVG